MRRLLAWRRGLNATERDSLTCLTYGPATLLLAVFVWQVNEQPVFALVLGGLVLALMTLSWVVLLLRSIELRHEVERQRRVVEELLTRE